MGIGFALADAGKMFQRVKKIFRLVALRGGVNELRNGLRVVAERASIAAANVGNGREVQINAD